MQVVIDKSFLQGRSLDEIRCLCGKYTVLFIETLLYELLTTESEKVREVCFAKLRGGNCSIVLIPSIGPLIRYEIECHLPASPLINHKVDATFESLVSGLSSHPVANHSTLAEWRLEIMREVSMFQRVATGILTWCPDLHSATGEELKMGCEALKQQACTNPEVVRRVYRSLGLEGFPGSSLLDTSWTLFRWVQLHLLFGLDYICRYGFAALAAIPNRIEHDIHDLQYTLFGALCGGLATKDNDIAKNFTMVCPDGLLLSDQT